MPYSGNNGLFVNGNSGSGGGWQPSDGLFYWCPDAEPLVPNALDDEFNAPTLDAKWTIGNPGGNFAVNGGGGAGTLDIVKQMLRVTSLGNGGNRGGWITQSLNGATEWTIYSRTAMMGQAVNSFDSGLFATINAITTSPATTPFVTCGRFMNTTPANGCIARNWTNYTAVSTTTLAYVGFIGPYLRMRCLGTIIERDTSFDGLEWFRLGTTFDCVGLFGGIPTRVGLWADCALNLFTGIARFPFFRAFTGAGSSAFDATSIGRQIALPIYP